MFFHFPQNFVFRSVGKETKFLQCFYLNIIFFREEKLCLVSLRENKAWNSVQQFKHIAGVYVLKIWIGKTVHFCICVSLPGDKYLLGEGG